MRPAKIIKYALTIIILSTLQVSFCRYIAIMNIVPNIMVAFVVSVAVIEGPVIGGVIGLISGIFIDALSSGTTIACSITYMYMAIICGIINTNYLRKNAGVAVMFTFFGTIVCEEFIHFLHFAIWGVSGVFSAIVYPILPVAVYSTVLAIPIYFVISKLFGSHGRRDYIQ